MEKQHRVDDALQLARDIRKRLEIINNLEKELSLAQRCLDDINVGNIPNKEDLKALGLTIINKTALRYRLKGIISNKQTQLQKEKNILVRDKELISKMTICPYCSGSGEITEYTYERFERTVQPKTRTMECSHCQGKGVLDLGNELANVIKEVNDELVKR